MIERAWTGKHLVSPRIRHHSRGRFGRSHWRTSMVSVQLREMTEKEAKLLNKTRGVGKQRKAALDPRGY